jgi:acyl carrier protein
VSSPDEIREWLVGRVAETVGLPADDVDVEAAFSSLGLGSREAVVISGELEELLGRTLSPTLLYDHPSIEALSSHLGGGR